MSKYAVFTDYGADSGPEIYDTINEAQKDFDERIEEGRAYGSPPIYLCQILQEHDEIDEDEKYREDREKRSWIR